MMRKELLSQLTMPRWDERILVSEYSVKYLWPDGKVLKNNSIANRTMKMNTFDDELGNECAEL